METFSYVIKDIAGIHAYPAAILAEKSKKYKCTVCIEKGGRSVNIARPVAILALGIQRGDKIRITADGEDEEQAIKEIGHFFWKNL